MRSEETYASFQIWLRVNVRVAMPISRRRLLKPLTRMLLKFVI